jgi:toxin ParE1/3/4
MQRKVLLTEDAERDLEEMYDYVAEFDSIERAPYVLDRLLETIERLTQSAERGTQPPELRSVGIKDYRQIFFKPYRVIYRLIGDEVIVYVIADGRRDLQTLLSRRLLGG